MPLHEISANAGDFALIFEQVLGADAASIDTGASGVPGGYSDLRLVILARSAEAVVSSALALRFNNDSGANYDSQLVQGADAAAASSATAAATSVAAILVPGTSAAANSFGAWDVLIPQYAATTAHKSGTLTGGFADSTVANSRVRAIAFRWRNTVAITRVGISVVAGSNLVTGSALRIYGLR